MKLHELNPHIRYARIQGVSLANGHTVHVCYDARLFFFENATGSVRIGKTVYEIKNNTPSQGDGKDDSPNNPGVGVPSYQH